MAAVNPTVPGSQKLPLRTKIIYGVADWGNTTTSTMIIFFFSFFLTDIAHLDPLYAAPVLLFGGIWDAINDPIIGMLADRVRTPWGRRRPLILIGSVPLAISFFLLWYVPGWQNPLLLAAYYLAVYLVFDTSFTVVTIPYSALTAELTEDYDERTGLTAYRMATSMAGGLVAAVVLPLVADQFADPKTGYMVVALIFSLLALVPYIILFFGIHERAAPIKKASINIVDGFVSAFNSDLSGSPPAFI